MSHALVIDDRQTNAQVLATLLAKQGVNSTVVIQVRQLAAVLDEIETLDLVFLDLEMPDLNGFDVLAMFKAHERFSQVPVIAYTVHVSEIQETQKAGFDGFLAKPLDPKRFPDQLARLLKGEAVWERV